jgi:metal-dependent amidase/aminoacylase/carboxypeptidase family protein
MIEAAIMDRFPESKITLGQHVMVGKSGHRWISHRCDIICRQQSEIKTIWQGAHGSSPQTSIDPFIMAAATTMRLQTIISSEVAPIEKVVLTI